jgi:hypothetical protein
MTQYHNLFPFKWIFAVVTLACGSHAATLTNNFNVNVNYLTNGVTGTIWDGVYFGAGEFNNSGTGSGGPGATVQCDANITAASTLTVQSTGTSWEGADDDGLFLYKVVKGDFSAIVRIVTPFDNSAYNTAGLQARAFSAGGDPFGGSEDYVSWTRFDDYNYPNYLRNEVNGGVQQINPGGYPNAAYWLRMDRVGNVFRFYQRTNSTDAWRGVSFPAPVNGTNLTRSDLAGQPLQVGLIHATFNNQIGVKFSDFSLTATNFDSFVSPPSPPTALTITTNANILNLAWTPGAGSAGSVVVVWTGTNVLKQSPVNGFSYAGNATYGLGNLLGAAGYYVVYSGTGSSVSVSNLAFSTTYNAAVFSYAGSGNSLAYNRTPPVARVTIPLNDLVGTLTLAPPDVILSFSANPGKWYWVQFTDTLSPPNWQFIGAEPVYANSTGEAFVHVNGALASQRFYRLVQMDSLFATKYSGGAITSLQRTGDVYPTEYLASGARLGDANLRYRQTGTNWNTSRTATLSGIASVTYLTSADFSQYTARYVITNSLSGQVIFESVLKFHQDTIHWGLNFTNFTGQSVEIGDVALPLRMNTSYSGITSSVLKHHFISGYGSFIFWMRPNSVGPYLLLTPDDNTKLEFWDVLNGGFEAYIHSLAQAGFAATNYPTVTTLGDKWRQTNTSLTLGAGASQSYGFKFQWVNDYDGVRQALVNEGKLDMHIVPGMTVPTNLFARIALRTTQTINGIDTEFPAQTSIQYFGVNGSNQLYQVQFSRLGENKLTIRHGNNRQTVLEFFVSEPVETLIKKRSAFLAGTQINDFSKWYNGLFAEWNMNDQVLVTPDNHDTITGFVLYEIASDDAGESRPAFMGEKLAAFPLQSEVAALDNYIQYFVWGGLQRRTNESFSYGVYGIPDWHQLRTNNSLSIGRGYDYPHIYVMYYRMYQVARYHPEVTTVLTAGEYLRRAYGTANAQWTYGGGQGSQIGLMNELVIPDIIDSLQAEGMTNEAATLRTEWQAKVNYYLSGNANLFGSEYAFDSTGFESQQAYAKYAMLHASTMGATNVPAFTQRARQFMDTQIAGNILARGWLETAYYYYGSDYRGGAGNDYVLSYMSAEGGWGLLDYGLYFATNAADYLRLGYASILSSWATMNSGPAPNYGFWYSGAGNDGGCGGGYEPSPYNTTWLGQPMHRGPWYYSAEENLGFCGAIRSAATVLADDPIFGRFCYGGLWTQSGGTNQITPLDGVRKRFHAMLGTNQLHLVLDTDRFAPAQSIACKDGQSVISFQVETGNPSGHSAAVHMTVSTPGVYTVSNNHGLVTTTNLVAGKEAVISLPVDGGVTAQPFAITR